MSGRVLSFKAYLGGGDNVQVIEMFPTTQKTFNYNFGVDITNYTFEADYQTLVVDTVTYDRTTGDPNFTSSTVIGYFPKAEIGAGNINVVSAASGTVDLTIPAQRYTGNIVPDARTNVPITVVGFTWTDTGPSPSVVESHRWAIIERYEPDTPIGDVILSPGYTAI